MLVKITASQALELVEQWLKENNIPQEYKAQTPTVVHDDDNTQFWEIRIRLLSVAKNPYIGKFTIPVETFIDAEHPTAKDLLNRGEEIKTGYESNIYDTFS